MTQGVLGITKNGETIYKVIAGCSGNGVLDLMKQIKKKPPTSLKNLYDIALDNVGCESCLIVMDGKEVYSPGCDTDDWDKESRERYRNTFEDPTFNPRWEYGTADYMEELEIE